MNNIETLKIALEALVDVVHWYQVRDKNDEPLPTHNQNPEIKQAIEAITAIRQAIEQAEKQEPVTVLPDGSAFAVMSWPLPKNHWLYAEREYRDGEYEPMELGKPILTHQLRDSVVSAVRYAVRGATNCGKEVDFDPDALVQNAVYALCGPYGQAIEQAQQAEPVAWIYEDELPEGYPYEAMFEKSRVIDGVRMFPVNVAPSHQPLTDEEIERLVDDEDWYNDPHGFARAIEAKLKEKNNV